MYKYFLLSLTFLPFEGGAQSLIDTCLQRYALGVLAEQIGQLTDVKYAGLVVQESSTGNVIANVSLLLRQGEFVKGPSNTESFPSPLGRAVMYMCLTAQGDDINNFVIDTRGGSYRDQEGLEIYDHNFPHGYGKSTLLFGFTHNSDVSLLKAAEKVFDKDTRKLAVEINRTGILFGGVASETYGRWDSGALLGYRNSYMSLLETCSWLSAVAGGRFVTRLNASDSGEPYDEIQNESGRQSLMRAMRMHVREGLGRLLDSYFVPVAGLTNCTPPDTEGFRNSFVGACFPYSINSPAKYSVCIQVLSKQKCTSGLGNAARKIIDYLNMRDLMNNLNANNEEPTPRRRLHPAER